jgi:drug/metabolite transporter (DMT)-like permease
VLAQGSPWILYLVLLAAVLHATWNLLAKIIPDQVTAFWLVNIAVIPSAAVLLLFFKIPSNFPWVLLLMSSVIHLAYNLFLLSSYRQGDLSRTYPIARGLAPPLVALFAYLILGERLSLLAASGIILVVVALSSLAFERDGYFAPRGNGAGYAVLTGGAIAGYSLIDGVASRSIADPLTYVAVLMGVEGTLVAVVLSAVRLRSPMRRVPKGRDVALGLTAGSISVVAYAILVWAQSRVALAEVSALRESSVVFASLYGAYILKEGSLLRRLLAGLGVAVGIALIVLG